MTVRTRRPAAEDAIHILPVTLLDDHRTTVTQLRDLSATLRIGLGWHYLLDLSWIVDQLRPEEDSTILDAGAGLGVLQWFLAERGQRVISVDRLSRTSMSVRLRSRYAVSGLRADDLGSIWVTLRRELRDGPFPRGIAREVWNGGERLRRTFHRTGEIVLYHQDLRTLEDIATDSIDAVAAVSALEHNAPDDLEQVVAELMRVLKPGGRLIATLGAARDADWYHEPSKGWCYTDASLRRIFGIDRSVPSNYDRYDDLFAELRACAELRDGLASFYFQSGDNGMPWGVWDPRYQSVGIVKLKPRSSD